MNSEIVTIKLAFVISLVFVASGISGFIMLQSWSSILDIILPKNETRPRHLIFPAEYFLDKQKYFYVMLLHMNVTLCVGSIILLAVATLLLASQEFVCGMFAVAR